MHGSPRTRFAALLTLSLAIAGCVHAGVPEPSTMATHAAALRSVLPVLDELGVTEWRDDDWCRDFAFAGGHVIRSDDPDSCNPLGGPTRPFDAAAQAAFDRVDQALRDAHVPIREISRPTLASEIDFGLRAGAFDDFSYVYDPGYDMPETIDGEWVPTAIDADWYFVWQDWN